MAANMEAASFSDSFRSVINCAASRSSLLARMAVIQQLQQHAPWIGNARSDNLLATLTIHPQGWTKELIVAELIHFFRSLPVLNTLVSGNLVLRLRTIVDSSPKAAWFSKIPSEPAQKMFWACLPKLSSAEYIMAFLVLHASRASILLKLCAEYPQELKPCLDSFIKFEQLDEIVQPGLTPFILNLAQKVPQSKLAVALRKLLGTVTALCSPSSQLPDWLLGATNARGVLKQTDNFQLACLVVLDFFTPRYQARVVEIRHNEAARRALLSKFMKSDTCAAIQEPIFGSAAEHIHIEDLCMWERVVDAVSGDREAGHVQHDRDLPAPGRAMMVSGLRQDRSESIVAAWANRVRRAARLQSRGSFPLFDVYRISHAAATELCSAEQLDSELQSDERAIRTWLTDCAVMYAGLHLADSWDDVDLCVVKEDWTGRRQRPEYLGCNQQPAAPWLVLGEVGGVRDATCTKSHRIQLFSLRLVQISSSDGREIARAVIGPDRQVYRPHPSEWAHSLAFLGALELAYSDQPSKMTVTILQVKCAYLFRSSDSSGLHLQNCMQKGSTEAAAGSTPPDTAAGLGRGEQLPMYESDLLIVSSDRLETEAAVVSDGLDDAGAQPQKQLGVDGGSHLYSSYFMPPIDCSIFR